MRLPRTMDGLRLRHVLDVRHTRFMSPAYLALARKYSCATVYCDSDDHPSFADRTGGFVYARLMRSQARLKSGDAPKTLDGWAAVARTWAKGGEPADLPRVEAPTPAGLAARGLSIFHQRHERAGADRSDALVAAARL